jgi:hypothetical protein
MPLDNTMLDQHVHQFPCHWAALLSPYQDVIHIAHVCTAILVQVLRVRPVLDGTGLSILLHSVGEGALREA